MHRRTRRHTCWCTSPSDGQRPGSGAVLAKLADVFLTHVLRTYLARAKVAGVLPADVCNAPAVGPAVELLHSQPQRRIAEVSAADAAGQAGTAAKNGWGWPVSA
jgi:hypothetical protein